MYKRLILLLCTVFAVQLGFSQSSTKSPKEFLGYDIGDRFTPHHRLIAYLEHVAATNNQVTLNYYGESYEHRPLVAVFVSSPQNMNQLETIRTDNLKRIGMLEGSPGTEIPIVWMSYNVHGNEAVGVETALMTLWQLIDPNQPESKKWLGETVVVIDPCLNPDGHSRYVNWYMQKANKSLQPDQQSVEHSEPWPGGRPNHYLYDLNRDWAWQVQKETQERNKLYNEWMPQVHVDFHEQGINSPYFFAPAAEPIHDFVTPFQREFQAIAGANVAKNFDKHAWLYFTREVFDMFYPSYGDSWPTFNGAIGMTYEQGGSGRAGLGVFTALGDTLTLFDRIIHHHTAGIATIEAAYQNNKRLLDEFGKFFNDHAANPKGQYRTYIVKSNGNTARLATLKTLLERNGIQYGYGRNRGGLNGYAYFSGKNESFSIEDDDLIVSAHQPKSVLVQTLFDPAPRLSDSLTYDITSWALPYAMGLETYAVTSRIEGAGTETKSHQPSNTVVSGALAYVSRWDAAVHGAFLSELLKNKVRVRFATRDFKVNGKAYKAGALIVGREGNDKLNNFGQLVVNAANKYGVQVDAVNTGYMESGQDFGSSGVRAVVAPKVALISGNGVSSLNFGEVWHYFEQELNYGLSILDIQQLNSADLSQYNVIVLPSGNYNSIGENGLRSLTGWVTSGGKLITMDGSVGYFVGKQGFGITNYLNDEDKKSADKLREQFAAEQLVGSYGERERTRRSAAVAGAIYEVKIDPTHPLAFGTGGSYFTLKNSSSRYAYLKNGVNAGIIPSGQYHRSGFVGDRIKPMINESLVFGVEQVGRGQVVYFVDNPMFRGFWENGKLIFNNALFLVGQ